MRRVQVDEILDVEEREGDMQDAVDHGLFLCCVRWESGDCGFSGGKKRRGEHGVYKRQILWGCGGEGGRERGLFWFLWDLLWG